MKLDKNGYSPSVISEKPVCYFCGSGNVIRHEVYHGSYRQKAKRLGAWVYLCPECHRQVHECGLDDWLKHNCYGRVKAAHGWTDKDFKREFGKMYR